ncbi:hypothetical protein CSAL01_05514 [Colletotrichum salicis]|uniref:Uncharacterized protein n=1 Tax=Colletotrichum salicis TaxID=1209931 RepID=A0A135UP59_9PEZI|nr:hypothetical protein CSAL01_05514 [Colletotrichum salicis]
MVRQVITSAPCMAPPIPSQCRQEAEAQLQNLLQKRGASSGQTEGFAGEQLREALKILADQLYSKPTHFTLELLQNADDNDYSACFLDADGKKFYGLETGCNENGFSLEHIDALCSIGKSTKKSAKEVHSGYIGEKGIGFKSGFEVASVVHILSGFYHFKLNKTEDMLGVLLPLPFPVIKKQSDTETTRMRLRISDRYYHGRIAKDLRKIKPEVLLFLRRLRHIVVQVGTEEAEYQATYIIHDEEFQGEVRSVAKRKSSTESKKEMKYIIVRRTVDEMPTEPKRESIHQSEVTLAFPVKDDGSPIIHEQQTFAYLPLGNYGFRYLERTPSRDVFWDSLDAGLLKYLMSLRVLESRLGCFQVPDSLVFIPPEFCLDDAPLIDCPKQRALHLAADYTPQNSLPLGLGRLGVKNMNGKRFISDFCDWVSQEKPDLGSKSPEWHGKVSAIWVATGQCSGRLCSLAVLPTINGTFAAASTTNLFLASRDVAWRAPRGLELVFVDPEARDDHRREALFHGLGVKKLSKREICERILKDHRTKEKRDDPRPLDCLVEEMVYLLRHRHLLSSLGDARGSKSIWVQTDDRLGPTRVRHVYYVDPDATPNLLSQHSRDSTAPMRALHPAYFERVSYLEMIRDSAAVEDSTAIAEGTADGQVEAELANEISVPKKETYPFIKWLQSSCGIAVLPRLTFFDVDFRDRAISRECRWLIANDPEGLFLLLRDRLLRDYHSDLHYIRKEVREMQISCRDGRKRRLKDTAVPSRPLLDSCPHLTFGEFPDPDNPSQPSPVELKDDFRGKMRDLKIFPMVSTADSSVEAPSVVYRSIDKDWYIGDRSVLRRAFVGKVDILDVDIEYIDKLMPLIKWLSLDNKLLSPAVQQRTVYKRARYIVLLGTDTDMKLPQFEVSLASGLSVERTIGDIRGDTEVGRVSITESNDSVKIVVLKNPFKNSNQRFDKELVDFFIRRCAIEDVSRVSFVSLILKASLGDVRDLLEGAYIRASIEDLGFCVHEAEEHAAAETGGMVGVNAVARGLNAELGLGVLRSRAYATDHSPRIYTSAQRDLSSCFKEIGLKAEIHARKYAFKPGKLPTDIFLIGRVYNVEKEKPDLNFYWNPWELINKGRLVMTVSEGYRIAPGDAAATPKAA